VRSGKRKESTYLLFFLACLLIFLFSAANGFPQQNGPRAFSPNDAESVSRSRQTGITDKIDLLVLLTVDKGEKGALYYKGEDLRSGEPLNIAGYVSGVVVLCSDEVEADFDGVSMSKIRRNDDGFPTCKYFGSLESVVPMPASIPSIHTATPHGEAEPASVRPEYLLGGYSYFPPVLGTGVSGKDRFSIHLRKGDSRLEIPVRQRGEHVLFRFQPGTRDEIVFESQGTAPEDYFENEADFQRRLTAVSEGIRSVESRMHTDLVNRVHLVDYGEIRNAVTCEGEKKIWFYANALREEPLDELKTMAEHETLHLVVDRHGFANDSELREHFADLKGFGLFSYERFVLMTKGVISDQTEPNPGEASNFFAFVDERNFLKGMKGGHSRENLEEFCTSFLHSLMSVERLWGNLDRPLTLKGGQRAHLLTQDEKREVLRDYLTTLEILKRSASREEEIYVRSGGICDFLDHAYLQAKLECENRSHPAKSSGIRMSATIPKTGPQSSESGSRQ